tara:strand:- start:404 stop:763 length:360 start_codon:yes stop_codon:yes gene_type:complete
MVCLREAEKENVGKPAYALWNTDKWKKKFQSQVTKGYQLLKKFEEKAIINALNSYRGKSIYSLRVKFLPDLIKKEQAKLEIINSREIKEIAYKDTTLSTNKKPFGKKSALSKLKDLDNE